MFDPMKTKSLLFLCAAFLAGCMDDRLAGGTGIGNPKGSVTVAMQAASSQDGLAKAAAPRNPDGSFTIIDAGGTAFTVRSGFANVGRIRMKLPDGIDCLDAHETLCDAAEVSIPGPIIADLMTGNWHPDPGTLSIPVGAYRRIDVRLEGKSNEKPGPDTGLDGHSLIIKGEFDHAGKTGRTFTIALDFEEDVRFISDTGLTVDSVGLNRFIIFLDVEKWLAGANITKCLEDGGLALQADGNLTIDKDNACGQLENDVKAAIKGSGSLGRRKD